MSQDHLRTTILQFSQYLTDGISETPDQCVLSDAVLLVNLDDEDGTVVPVTDNIEFSGVKPRTCTYKNHFSPQDVRFPVSFAFFVNRGIFESPMQNST